MILGFMVGMGILKLMNPIFAILNFKHFGMVFISGMCTLYAIQFIVMAAKSEEMYDPINKSLMMYIIFIALLMNMAML